MSERLDVAIVGSGPGGALVYRECVSLGLRVRLLERGRQLKLDESTAYSSDEMFGKYKRYGQTMMFGKPLIQYVEGSVLGGGSEINSGLYHRIPGKILEEWEAQFGVTLNHDDLQMAYQENEELLHVCLDETVSGASAKLQALGVGRDFNVSQVPRWYRPLGDGGVRQSMSEAVFRHAPNSVSPGCEVKQLRETRDGVELHYVDLATHDKQVCHANFVWVCGGSVDTPLLLRRSGFRNRHIGRHLMCHPTVKLLVQFREPIVGTGAPVGVHQIKFDDDISFGCSICKPPYLMLHVLDKSKEVRRRVSQSTDHCAIYYAMIRPTSVGKVHALLGAPFVVYALSRSDKVKLRIGLLRLGDMFSHPDVELRVPSVSGVDSFEQFKERGDDKLLNQLNVMTIHLFSSCRMAATEDLGAVDSHCRVFGSKRVYVGDASILPSAPGVNPQGSLMALVKLGLTEFRQSFC
jgi:choline dehydrogenase-like flavoprotein